MTWRNSRRRQDGFTLIEVIVVLVILGLMLGLVVARGPLRSRTLEARAAAREVAQALRSARALAIGSDRPVEFVLDLAAHSYRVGDGAPHPLPAGLAAAAFTVAGEAAGPRAGISFAPDGSASGGRIELAQGARRLQVGVDWLTGRVSIADAP